MVTYELLATNGWFAPMVWHHSPNCTWSMLRRLSVGLLASALAIAPLPTKAQDGTAEDLGDVMSISLKDVVKPTIGFQGALQGAGTPNQAGIGGFLPLSVGENSVWFLDALVNAHFGDREGYSSIINTDVASGFSTSTRLGYRWLNGDRSWIYGLNAGYDSRSLKSGNTYTGVSVTNKKPLASSRLHSMQRRSPMVGPSTAMGSSLLVMWNKSSIAFTKAVH